MNKLTDTLAKKAKIPYYKKTAYVLFAFALLVFIMTYFVLMIVLYRTQVQETNNLKSSLTSQYCSSVDLSLTSTIENLDTFALSEPIVDLVLRPPTSSYEQKIQILSSLKDFLKKNDCVSDMFLCVHTNGEIYSPYTQISRIEGSYCERLLKEYVDTKGRFYSNSGLITAGTALLDGQLYLVCEVFFSCYSPLATFLLKIDPNILFEKITPETDIVFLIQDTAANTVLLRENAVHTNTENLENLSNVVSIVSPLNGWTYSLISDRSKAHILQNVILRLIPSMSIVCIVLVPLLWLMIDSITRPIKRFFQKVSEHSPSRPNKPRAETADFDSAISTYVTAMERHNTANKLLNQVSYYALTSLFNNLLKEKESQDILTINEIKNTLQEIDTQFTIIALVVVLVVSEPINSTSGQSGGKLSCSIFLNSILYRFYEESKIAYHVFDEDPYVVCVLQQTACTNGKSLQESVQQIAALIESSEIQTGIATVYGCGSIEDSLCTLHRSYHKAKLDFYPKLYAKNTLLKECSSSESSKEHQYWYKLFVSKFNRNDAVNPTFSLQELYTVIDNCAEMVKDISSLANIYRSFFEYLIVILEGLFIDKDTISNFTTKFEQLFEEKPKRDNVISHIKVACADSHHMMSLQINKRQNKYIKRALSILKDKYSDNNLNLKGISSELGISQAYLSTLFNNCMGVSFSTYLNFYRIDRAKELMTKNNILIKDVGEMVGFGTTQTFINVFKKQTGKTPKKWIDENIHTNALL